ncbi:ArnT family glycosyltransferase [Marinobacter bohaiensis]|uniref:ArnT family glycosyltransferase n=1 Tax=Marinobacter bohaiensis TaxID=2201898 RepID=UPI000DADF121|nr:glycosyltransferase family 39 protein [Marinobacter bohaiensis]
MFRSVSPWLWALAAILFSRLLGMALFPLVDTTEPRYAEIARLMAETGDWITPWFESGEPFWGKPPLSFWAQAASIKLFGVSPFAIRVPSWLAMLGVLYLTGRLALALTDRATARWSVLILASMALSYVSAGAVMTDPFLTLGTTLSLVSFALVNQGQERIWRWFFFLGLAIGLLAKGPLALVLTGLPIGGWLLLQGQWRARLRAFPWFTGTLLTAALTLPWYILAELKTPGFLDYFIVGEHFRRFIDPGWTGDLYGSAHDQPKGMIWVFWLWASFPWGLLTLGLMASYGFRLWRDGGRTRKRAQPPVRFLWLATLAPMVFFTLAGNTLWTYVLPALPFSAILLARELAPRLADRKSRWRPGARALTATVPALIAVVALASPALVEHLKTERPLVRVYTEIKRPGDSALLYLDEVPFSARYYSRGLARETTLAGLTRMRQNRGYARYLVAVPRDEQALFTARFPTARPVRGASQRYVLLSLPGNATARKS